MESIKINEFTIEVTKAEVVTKTNRYDVNFLIRQRVAIQKSLDEFTTARLAELAEVDELLGHCDKLGITVKPEPGTEILLDPEPESEPGPEPEPEILPEGEG